VLLYLILVPVNCVRLAEIMRVTRRVEEAARRKDLSGLWLMPYMKARRLAAGTVVFRKGDAADALFLLMEGSWNGWKSAPASPAASCSARSPSSRRTGRGRSPGRCVTDCLVMKIRGDAFKELYFENPKFAFHVSELIAERLITDVRKLQHKLDTMPAPLSPELHKMR
jgi:hypothetical protein